MITEQAAVADVAKRAQLMRRLRQRGCRLALDAFISLAEQFNMDTVAEYVASEATAGRLARLSVKYGQGYAFGRPQPLEAQLAMLRAGESTRRRALWTEK